MVKLLYAYDFLNRMQGVIFLSFADLCLTVMDATSSSFSSNKDHCSFPTPAL